VAIAAELRHAPGCELCRRRREALSPLAVAGRHASLGELPEAAVEAIHQVANDPARLSRVWFEKVLAAGLGDAPYVELLGVVVGVLSIDRFARALGIPPRPLPAALPGEPSRRRPAGVRAGEAFVSMLPVGAATGPEADLYPRVPRVPNVVRALSLVPDEVRALLDLSTAHYLSPEQMMDLGAGRALDRRQIELLAGRVSALNECFY
jgi:alkylhydroperoxidase family enzyme